MVSRSPPRRVSRHGESTNLPEGVRIDLPAGEQGPGEAGPVTRKDVSEINDLDQLASPPVGTGGWRGFEEVEEAREVGAEGALPRRVASFEQAEQRDRGRDPPLLVTRPGHASIRLDPRRELHQNILDALHILTG